MTTILSVNNYYYYRGGAETVFLLHNDLLLSSNYNVVPFSMRHPNNLDTIYSNYFIKTLEFGNQYSFFDKILNATKIVYSLEARRKINKILDINKIDLCHIHNIYHHISPSILHSLKKHKIPTVMTLHDLKLACPAYLMLTHDGICERCKKLKLYNVFINKCLKNSRVLSTIIMFESYIHKIIKIYERNVNYFLVPSKFHLKKLTEWGINKHKLIYFPNFIDTSKINFQPHHQDYLLYFGRISKEKGINTLIEAAIRSGVNLKLAGTGPYLSSVKSRIANNPNIKALGYLSGDRLHTVISNSKATILPSEIYENCPMSILESYAFGKPVIGSDLGGISELIQENKTGFTFKNGDVHDLSQKLSMIMKMRKNDYFNICRNSRRFVEQRFSKRKYFFNLKNIYKSLIL